MAPQTLPNVTDIHGISCHNMAVLQHSASQLRTVRLHALLRIYVIRWPQLVGVISTRRALSTTPIIKTRIDD